MRVMVIPIASQSQMHNKNDAWRVPKAAMAESISPMPTFKKFPMQQEIKLLWLLSLDSSPVLSRPPPSLDA